MKFFAPGIRTVTSRDNYSSSNGGSSNPNAPEANIPSDLEVATQGGVAAGQPVLMVPYEMILTGTKAREELGPIPRAEDTLKEDLPSFYLMVKLLKECERKSNSVWYHWLDSLPWWFCNGSSLTEPCYELLPKAVARLVHEEHARFQRFAKALEDAPCLSPRIRRDAALVHWAFCIVATRSVPLVSQRLNYTDAQLIPNADMFNHAHASVASIDLETDPDTGNCLAVALQNVPAGNPLRRSYGNFNLSQLLARYGFVDTACPFVPCLFWIDRPSREVIRVGYDPAKLVFAKDTGDVAQEVWDVLLYHVVLDQATSGRADDSATDKNRTRDRQAFLQAVVASGNGNHQSTAAKKQINALHSKYYAETVQALRQHVESVAAELADLSQKASLVGNETRDSDPRLFLVNRHNALLQQVFGRVRARLASQNETNANNNNNTAEDVWGMLQKY